VVRRVTIVDTQDRELEEMLGEGGALVSTVSGTELASLVGPSASHPDAIILDIRTTKRLPPALASIKRQHPTTGIVIVASTLEPTLLLEAMRGGVSEWVTSPISRQDLDAALSRVVVEQPTPDMGQVFGFVGAKGGTGTTTTAVNVAVELAMLAPGRTLLIDLHLLYGDAAVLLGVEPHFTVIDALENIHRLDDAFFRSLVVRTREGLDLLAAGSRPFAVDAVKVGALVAFAAQYYWYTVVDVPRTETIVLDALQHVSALVVVATQELTAVRNASRMVSVLRPRYGKDRVKVILNRFDRQLEITPEDLERVDAGRVMQVVPNDWRLAQQAQNAGRPLSLENHSKVAASFKALARMLAGVEASGRTPTPRGIFGLSGRSG
jgi:pilus assembly protein CpaE